MATAGQGLLITNDEPFPFCEFGRQLGDAAGYPTDRTAVKSIPVFVGMLMAIIAELTVWIMWFEEEDEVGYGGGLGIRSYEDA
jgi:hypothetical protein